jgi:hypothetical protein
MYLPSRRHLVSTVCPSSPSPKERRNDEAVPSRERFSPRVYSSSSSTCFLPAVLHVIGPPETLIFCQWVKLLALSLVCSGSLHESKHLVSGLCAQNFVNSVTCISLIGGSVPPWERRFRTEEPSVSTSVRSVCWRGKEGDRLLCSPSVFCSPSLFILKNRKRLMRSPYCLCVYVPPKFSFSMWFMSYQRKIGD